MTLLLNQLYYDLLEALAVILFLKGALGFKKTLSSKWLVIGVGTASLCVVEVLCKEAFFFGFMAAVFLVLIFFVRLFCEGDVLKQEGILVLTEGILLLTRIISLLAAKRIMGDYQSSAALFPLLPYCLGTLLNLLLLGGLCLIRRRKRNVPVWQLSSGGMVLLWILAVILFMSLRGALGQSTSASGDLGMLFFTVSFGFGATAVSLWEMPERNRYLHLNGLLQEKLTASQADAIRMEEDYQNARKIRHDFNRNLTIYASLLKEEKYGELEEELHNQIKKLPEERFFSIRGNSKISAVLNEKLALGKSRRIEMTVRSTAAIQEKMEMDAAIILSNLIDNALEAGEDDSGHRVFVSLFERNGMYNMLVQNTIYGSAAPVEQSQKSSDKGTGSHGVGLVIVRELVEKYGGLLDQEKKDNRFGIHVALPNEP